MILKGIFGINSKIEIALADTDDQIFGQSLIQEVFETSLSIMVPLIRGHVLNLNIGDKVLASVLIRDRRYIFETVVLDKERGQELVIIKMPKKMISADRRNSVRIKVLLPVRYGDLGTRQPEKWEKIEPGQEAIITSLSGRGLALSLKRKLEKGTILVLNLNLEGETLDVKEKLLGEVVRCEQNDDRYHVGVKFLSVLQRQEDIIVKYVFQCLRKAIQLIRDDW